jgi:hypothetical protein
MRRAAADCTAVRLAWALVAQPDGSERLLPVSRFAGRDRADRPPARCPVCREPVTLRLGPVRMHHAAHRPGARCTADAGEGALHLNAKCALWARLTREAGPAARLAITAECRETAYEDGSSRRGPCGARHESTWLTGWDRAELEVAMGATRPDLLLRRGDVVVGAIEIVATHAVDRRKARALSALGAPWVEVAARDAAEAAERWGDLVLPTMQLGAVGTVGGPWRCALHARRAAERATRQANGFRPWKARIVDCYLPGGRWTRDVFVMEAELRGGRVVAVRLVHGLDDDVIAKATRPEREGSARELHAAFVRWARSRRAEGTIVDSPMPWVAGARLAVPVAQREGRGPLSAWRSSEVTMARRWRWERAREAWVRVAGVMERGWPTVPSRPSG